MVAFIKGECAPPDGTWNVQPLTFLKEVSGLRLLSENKARNINHIIDALLLGQTMWMVTEYCGGGSVASLVGVHGYLRP